MTAHPLAGDAVAAIDAIHGRHDGFRAAHAKGSFCSGRFTPSPAAAQLCDVPHFAAPVVVLARFSNGGSHPDGPDNERLEGRGFAVKLYLPDGSDTDIVALTLPCFFVRTPEDFVTFTTARAPDPETGQPDAAALAAFVGAHPETAAALGHIAPTFGPPVSYATCAYNSIHAFHLEGADRYVRWRWEPEAGEARLAEEDIDGAGRDYLQDELRERIADGPIRFTLVAILAADDDDVDDPTVPWPPERERVEMGVLELTAVVEDREHDDHIEVFDPTRLPAGIAPSDDPILRFRHDAYDVSATRRWHA